MKDYDAIKGTIFHYHEGYRDKNCERLEKAFLLEIANMMGYKTNLDGKLGFLSMTMKGAIDEWVAPRLRPLRMLRRKNAGKGDF